MLKADLLHLQTLALQPKKQLIIMRLSIAWQIYMIQVIQTRFSVNFKFTVQDYVDSIRKYNNFKYLHQWILSNELWPITHIGSISFPQWWQLCIKSKYSLQECLVLLDVLHDLFPRWTQTGFSSLWLTVCNTHAPPSFTGNIRLHDYFFMLH